VFLQGWFIFTTVLLLCTLKSTVAFFSLFFTLDLAFLFLAISFLMTDAKGKPNHGLTVAGGVFGILAAFLAWYNALAGIADTSNRYDNPAWFYFSTLCTPRTSGADICRTLFKERKPDTTLVSHPNSEIRPFADSFPQLLHHPRRTLPVVCEGPREERPHRQGPQCLNPPIERSHPLPRQRTGPHFNFRSSMHLIHLASNP
jgi:GPR1/FUN34/yaaH family